MKKRNSVALVLIALILLPIASAGLLDWFKEKVQLGPNANTDVRVGVGNADPQITSVDAIPNIILNPNSTTNIYFNYTARDPNGASDLNDATATANFSRAGEPTRIASNCDMVLEASKSRTYQCNISMQYYDQDGLWDIAVRVEDSVTQFAEDTTTQFTIDPVLEILLGPATINFPTVVPGGANASSSENTTILNYGNVEVPARSLSITAYDLIGETTSTESIPAANFTAGDITVSDVCLNGNALANDTTIQITSAALPRGPLGSNTGEFQYCLVQVPEGISSQFYSTTASGSSWTIQLS